MKRLAGYTMLSVVAVAALSVCLCVPARAMAKEISFSATLIMESGGTTTDGRIYFTTDKQRTEMNGVDSGQDAIAIVRLDKKVVWTLMPSEMIYMEMPINQQQSNPLTGGEDIISRERIGKDTVDGHPTIKEKVTVRDKDGNTTQMYYWQATDIGWPIKAEAIDGSWRYTYRDIRMGRQDPALFEVPDGYQKMSMPDMQAPRQDYPEPPAPDYPEPPAPDYPEPPTPSFPEPPTPDFYVPSPF